MVPADGASKAYRDRCEFWGTEFVPKTARRLRARESNPLVLAGHGLSLRIDRGCLLVRDGNTHYPAKHRQWRFFPGALDIPRIFVIIDGSGEITMDALDWLATQGVSLIRLRWDAQFVSVITTGGQAASADKVYWQKNTRDDPKARLAFAVDLIREKVNNTIRTMEALPRTPTWDRAYKDTTIRAKWLERRPPRTIASLLGIEGVIAANYFRAWSGIPMSWKTTKRYPIPEDWSSYQSRTAVRDEVGRSNRSATHPVNAMLNYAYGVLVARTQIQLIVNGYDPTVGIMHDNKSLRGTYPAFVLDHIEPMRPVVDQAVLQLIDETTFTGADFSIQNDGVCRLNPELARRVAKLTMKRCEQLPFPTRGWQYQRKRSSRAVDAGI
jgi:CRISPR-associated protein Cas1